MDLEVGSEYYGLFPDQYEYMMSFDWFREDWADNFTSIGGGQFYAFTAAGNETEDSYFELLIDNDIDEEYGFAFFKYISSTQNVGGTP